jgi:hypothetical protein
MKWSFVVLAQHGRPGRRLSCAAAYHPEIGFEKNFEKIRNAEMGNLQ